MSARRRSVRPGASGPAMTAPISRSSSTIPASSLPSSRSSSQARMGNMTWSGTGPPAASATDARNDPLAFCEPADIPIYGDPLPQLLEWPAKTSSDRSEEHTYELQSLMRISYDVFCLKKKNSTILNTNHTNVNDQDDTHHERRI